TASTTYTYAVKAVDAAGNASALSASVSATTLAQADTTPPSVPTGLTASAISQTQINLSWQGSTDNVGVTGYQVFRGGAQIATATGTTYSDIGLTASTTYTYAVKAVDAAGNASALSASVSATTLALGDILPPSVPTGLTASVVSQSQINLSWLASTDNVGVTGYQVFRGGAQIATATGTTYSDTGLKASTTYTYAVKAVDAAGNASVLSAGASATTPD